MRSRKILKAALALGFSALALSFAQAATLTADAVWSGVVNLEEDLLIVKGVTLTIKPGTKVVVYHTDSTKTDPQFWNPDTEIAVEGRLVVGASEGGRTFIVAEGGGWGGVIVAPGGEARFTSTTMEGADEALLVKEGTLALADVEVKNSSRGIILAGGANFSAEKSVVSGCEIGVIDLAGIGALPGLEIKNSKDAARLEPILKAQPHKSSPGAEVFTPAPGTREFVGEYTVEGEEEWRGTIIIDGRVTVPPGSMLKILPGAKVLFRKRDTNSDGLGESELLILGSVRCAGTAKNPVLFASAENPPAPGDWDKVSIISSEDAKNSFEYATFRHGLMALHAHYSNFSAKLCRFEDNYRAVQFQESEGASVEECVFVNNKQALRFRDSKVKVRANTLTGNDYALHAFRCDLELADNTVTDTKLGGVLLKESRATLRKNIFRNNLSPLKQKGSGSTLKLERNGFSGSVETTASLSGVDARIEKNTFEDAGLDLIGLEAGEVVLRGNTFGAAGRNAIHLNGSTGADARCNDFKTSTPASRIHDRADDPALGIVLTEGPCD